MNLTHKIKDILPQDWENPKRLGDKLNYTVEEYLDWYNSQKKPNKPFVKLFELCKSLLNKPDVPKNEEAPIQIVPALEKVPIEILDYYKAEYSPQIVYKLKKLFQIENLAQAAVLDMVQVNRIITGKKHIYIRV